MIDSCTAHQIQFKDVNMRAILAALGLSLTLVNPSFASDDDRELLANDAEYMCNMVLMNSQEIMSARLRGVSIVEVMKIAGKSDNPVSKLMKLITIDAYSEYAYTDAADKEIAIREFGIKNYLVCIENFN